MTSKGKDLLCWSLTMGSAPVQVVPMWRPGEGRKEFVTLSFPQGLPYAIYVYREKKVRAEISWVFFHKGQGLVHLNIIYIHFKEAVSYPEMSEAW